MMVFAPIDANDMLMEAQLDGSVYHVGLSWNDEGQLWTLSIRDLNLSVMASGLAVVDGWPLLHTVRRPEFPPGEFVVEVNSNKPIGRKSFVDGHAYLFYLSPADINNAAL